LTLRNSLKMIKIGRNVSELRIIVCKNIILTLVHLLVLLCELFINARTRINLRMCTNIRCIYFFPAAPWLNASHGILILEFTHSGAPQSVGLLWTSDGLIAETEPGNATRLTTEKYAIRNHEVIQFGKPGM